MPYFKGDYTAEQLEVMRRAASECAARLGVQGRIPDERDIAVAILAAASQGCMSLDELIAAGMASIRNRRLQ